MGWVIGIAVVLVVVWIFRKVRRRRAPHIDQSRLENANYSRIGQDTHNNDIRFGGT